MIADYGKVLFDLPQGLVFRQPLITPKYGREVLTAAGALSMSGAS
jgi:hypothetical protein